ncbi:DMT family transporter [Cypionkella sp.]|uniref:DMT family transporter n=1 Tax=Cypionkella sp. TaxID=2811411 RepID=UPI0026225E6B|nr:DMT family transporter [Cypionkella sp.]
MIKRPLWLAAAPIIFLLLWSGGFGVAKLGLQHAEPLTLLALRYTCVLALLLPLALIVRPPLPKTKRAWADVAITGFLIQVVYFGLCYIAFKAGVSAGGVAIIVCLQPILVALAAPYTVKEATTRLGWIGLTLGLAGAAIAILSRSSLQAENPWGILLTFGALLGMTGGTLYEKRFGVSQHPITANLIQYATGALFTLPAAYLTEGMIVQWSPEFLLILGYLVIGNSILAISLLLAMIRAGEVARVSALFYLVPALSALFAWPLLGEAMPPLAWAGMALAGLGVALVSKKSRVSNKSGVTAPSDKLNETL